MFFAAAPIFNIKTSVPFLLRRKACIERPIRIRAPFVRHRGRAKHRVLVEGEEVFILKDANVGLRKLGKICSYDKGAFHGSPEGEVRARLCEREGPVADFEHISIGVSPKVCGLHEKGVHVEDTENGRPAC